MIIQRYLSTLGDVFFKSVCVNCAEPIMYMPDQFTHWFHTRDHKAVCRLITMTTSTMVPSLNGLDTWGNSLAMQVTGGFLPSFASKAFYQMAEPELYEITELGVLV